MRILRSRQVWKRWRLAPPAYELCVQSSDGTRALPESPHVMHIFFVVGLVECTSKSHDTLVDGLRMHPEANGYAKRLLADKQTLAFVLEWAEQVANVELEFGDVFRLGSKLNDWFLSLDLRQIRAALFTQTVAPCRVELSDDDGDDDLEGKNENYICTLLDENGRECGQRWSTARALAAHQCHTQGNAWRTKGSGKPGGRKSVFLVRITHASIRDNLKTYGSCRKTKQMRG